MPYYVSGFVFIEIKRFSKDGNKFAKVVLKSGEFYQNLTYSIQEKYSNKELAKKAIKDSSFDSFADWSPEGVSIKEVRKRKR